jgi:hypothetical protein
MVRVGPPINSSRPGALSARVRASDHHRDQSDAHDHALVGVVDVAVARVVVDERVAILHADGWLVDPVLVDEPHRIVQDRGERQHAARTDVRQVSGRRVHGTREIAPLGAGGRARLLHHLECLVEPGDDPLAHPIELVGVDLAGEQPLLLLGARLHRVTAHDLGRRPEEQGGLRQELVDPIVRGLVGYDEVMGVARRVHGVSREVCSFRNQIAP